MAKGHYKSVCEWGFAHGQCRCPSPTKTVQYVKCSTPDKHAPAEEPEVEAKQHMTLAEAKTKITSWRLPPEMTVELGMWLTLSSFGRAIMDGLEEGSPEG